METKIEKLNEIQELQAAIRSIKCEEQVRSPFLGLGNYNAKYMFICERPGYHTTAPAHGITLLGNKSGDFFFECLVANNLSINDVYITNVVKVQKEYNSTPTEEEIAFWKPILLKEIAIVKPDVIILLGKVAFNVFFENESVLKYAGKYIFKDQQKYYVLPHTAWALRMGAQEEYKAMFKELFTSNKELTQWLT